MTRREVAWRVFAGEYNEADMEVKEDGDRSPSFVVTPLGSRVNRLLVVGVLTSNEDIGREDPFWRAQVTDPTGVYHVYAGQYQPEAAAALSEITPPAVVAVVGKSRTYSPEEGTIYTSITPEQVRVVDVEERNRWVVETARHTMERVEAMERALTLENPDREALAKLDVDARFHDGILEALEHYGRPALRRYVDMVRDALESILPAGAELRSDFAPADTWDARDADEDAPAKPGAPAAEPEATEGDGLVEDRIFELTGSLDDGKGAPWEEIVAEASEEGITEEQVEEALNALMDRGQIYEPVLGRLKRT